MRGRVLDGKIVLEGEAPPDGTRVRLVVDPEPTTFDLIPSEEAELLQRIREVDEDHVVDAWHSLRDLGSRQTTQPLHASWNDSETVDVLAFWHANRASAPSR